MGVVAGAERVVVGPCIRGCAERGEGLQVQRGAEAAVGGIAGEDDALLARGVGAKRGPAGAVRSPDCRYVGRSPACAATPPGRVAAGTIDVMWHGPRRPTWRKPQDRLARVKATPTARSRRHTADRFRSRRPRNLSRERPAIDVTGGVDVAGVSFGLDHDEWEVVTPDLGAQHLDGGLVDGIITRLVCYLIVLSREVDARRPWGSSPDP